MHSYLRRACTIVAACLPVISVGSATSHAAVAGAQLWVNRYSGPNGADQANAVAPSPDGKMLFVTGFSQGATSLDYATVAYSAASGQQLWVARYDGPAHYIDEASSVAVSPNGQTVFVTGFSFGAGHVEADYATIAYNAGTGQRLWVERYAGPNKTTAVDATSVAVSPDGTAVFVTGYTYGVGTFDDYATIAYSAASGRQLWVSRYNGAPNSVDQANAVAVSPDGTTVFVTGESAGSAVDYATIAYDAATGHRTWVARYGPPSGKSAAAGVAVSPSGSTVFVTGYSDRTAGSGGDYATIAYSAASGHTLWAARYDGPAHADDQAASLAVSAGGKTVYVTGESDTGPGNAYDYATVGYDAGSGRQIWAARYTGPGTNNAATAVAVSGVTGKVYVTGYSYAKATAGYDYATVAYDPLSGHQLWASRYDGPLHQGDKAFSVSVSPATGTVFVTGASGAAGTVPDYATVAYSG